MAPPPPPLHDDAVTQILLRLPPDEPECLFRASLVCKPWLRILRDPAFLRSYRAFHGAPPLLGIFQRKPIDDNTYFCPVTAVPAFPHPGKGFGDLHRSRVLDSRHGRVLIDEWAKVSWAKWRNGRWGLVVWDPVTGEHRAVPNPDKKLSNYCAAVICADGGCDHLDCRGKPFRVALVANDGTGDVIRASVYSSETDLWSPATTCDANGDFMVMRRGALVGDQIYFIALWPFSLLQVNANYAIVSYGWDTNHLSLINPPPLDHHEFALTVINGTSPGLVSIQLSSLHLWSREVNIEGVTEWMQCRVIELEKVMPMAQPHKGAVVVGFAEGVDVIFVSTDVGLFMFDLNSGRVRKAEENWHHYSGVFPYMSFYTPGQDPLSSLAKIH